MTAPIHMSKKARAAAKSLAISYSAWTQAVSSFVNESSPVAANSICVWGPALIEKQRTVGVVLCNEDTIERLVATARRVLSETVLSSNEILDDMVMLESNLPTGHRHVVRTGIPTSRWRTIK